MLRKKSLWSLVILLFFFSLPVDAQCAMCRAVLESEEGQSTAKGLNNGILYLMVIPYILIGGIGYVLYKNKKRKKEES
ncbi:hypothetical protein HN014_09615 [Aquimarina sp. TRL1]|uniref:hypothetical protein n=1 Tax=Aquimarina TaxID=290174 RepID=UPI00158E44F0|nr:hypothetical protein [Aquimarina sp. TRL1]QKX05166.1 hypothetical protein HN014_09615 [Aquimarina sp. TRL1]